MMISFDGSPNNDIHSLLSQMDEAIDRFRTV